nr:hypothetical protein [uncultured Gellertiella sp.]
MAGNRFSRARALPEGRNPAIEAADPGGTAVAGAEKSLSSQGHLVNE